MGWQLAALGKILTGNIAAPWVFKSLGRPPTRIFIRRLIAQYVIALGCAAAYALWSGSLTAAASVQALPIFLVAILASSGFYFHLRAYSISLSRSAIFDGLVAVIPITLSITLLGEWRVLTNGLLLVGVGIAGLGIALHFVNDARVKSETDTARVPPIFYAYGVGFVLVTGIVTFLMNVWAKSSVPSSLFLVAWYAGALVGSGLLFLFLRFTSVESPSDTSWDVDSRRTLVLLAGLALFANQWFLFTSFQMVELVVLAPFYVVGDIFGPIVMGMLFFKEWQTLRGRGWLYFAIALLGVCIVAFAR